MKNNTILLALAAVAAWLFLRKKATGTTAGPAPVKNPNPASTSTQPGGVNSIWDLVNAAGKAVNFPGLSGGGLSTRTTTSQAPGNTSSIALGGNLTPLVNSAADILTGLWKGASGAATGIYGFAKNALTPTGKDYLSTQASFYESSGKQTESRRENYDLYQVDFTDDIGGGLSADWWTGEVTSTGPQDWWSDEQYMDYTFA